MKEFSANIDGSNANEITSLEELPNDLKKDKFFQLEDGCNNNIIKIYHF